MRPVGHVVPEGRWEVATPSIEVGQIRSRDRGERAYAQGGT